MYRKLMAVLLIAAGSMLVASPAVANPNREGCHGASDKPCKDDPNPDKGKECEAHGRNVDGNEDHCATQEIVTPPVVVVVVEDPTPVVEPVVDDSPVRTGTPVSIDEAVPAADVLAADTVLVPVPTEIGTALVLTKPEPLTQLPRTGSTGLLLAVGLGLVLVGLGLRTAGA